MKNKLKTVLIIVCSAVLIIGAGLFGIYKYFVTPDKMLLLSLLSMRDDISTTLNYIPDDEKEIISRISDNGGKLSVDGSIDKLSDLENIPVSMTINSDKSCTVTSLELYDKFEIDVYKDSTQLLVNTPLFKSGGFNIPIGDFANAWNNSIFKDILTVSDEYTVSDIAIDMINGNIDAKAFVSSRSGDILNLAKSIEITDDGKSKVMVGDKTKTAKRYKAHITKDEYDTFVSYFTDYFSGTEYGKQKLDATASQNGISIDEAENKLFNSIISASDDIDVTFMVYKNKIREITVEYRDSTYTLAFSGDTNVFDIISYYKNGDIENEIRRVQSRTNSGTSDTITVAGKNFIDLETDNDGFSFALNSDYASVSIEASGKSKDDDSVSFNDVNMNLNDLITIDGSVTVSDVYDNDFSFNKSGEYVNLFSLSQVEWERVSGSLIQLLGLLTGE